jgi:hypothetical protein
VRTTEPLLLIAFNRPDHFEQLIERLRETEPQRIYVAVDGPRPGHPTDTERVLRTRELVSTIDWTDDVHTLIQESNLGCGLGVSTALTWFFDHEERGIILEDDILPRATFFDFCTELLDRYAEDPRVLMVSGCNFVPPDVQSHPELPYRFSRVPHIWGWASWRRSWELFRLDIAGWGAELDARALWRSVDGSPGGFLFWKANFDLMARKEIDTLDYQFTFAGFQHQALTATSNVNLVDNVGWGGDATHTVGRPAFLRESEEISLPMVAVPVEVDVRADQWTRRYVFGATLSGLAGKTVRYVRQKIRPRAA